MASSALVWEEDRVRLSRVVSLAASKVPNNGNEWDGVCGEIIDREK